MEIETTSTNTTATTERVLANCRQRYMLYCLHRHSEQMKLADIAEQITVWETGTRGERQPKRRLQIYNTLYHDHIPALCEADLVSYDQQADTVELTECPQIRSSVQHRFRQEIVGLLEAECRALEKGEQQ